MSVANNTTKCFACFQNCAVRWLCRSLAHWQTATQPDPKCSVHRAADRHRTHALQQNEAEAAAAAAQRAAGVEAACRKQFLRDGAARGLRSAAALADVDAARRAQLAAGREVAAMAAAAEAAFLRTRDAAIRVTLAAFIHRVHVQLLCSMRLHHMNN